MHVNNELVFSLEEHQAIQSKHSEFIKFGVSFPNNVFTESFDNLKLIYFDQMLTPDFCLLLSALANWAGDTEITMLIYEPDPVTFYFDYFKHYGSLRFNHPSLGKTYSEVLNTPPNNPEPFLYCADIISWVGTSGRWCFFGDRNFEIGIGIIRSEQKFWPVQETIIYKPIESLNIDEALDIMSLNFKKQTIPKEFISEFRKNYDR